MGGIVGSFDRALEDAVMVRDLERTVGQYEMRGFIVAGRGEKSIPGVRRMRSLSSGFWRRDVSHRIRSALNARC
jgi:hypothetical protein